MVLISIARSARLSTCFLEAGSFCRPPLYLRKSRVSPPLVPSQDDPIVKHHSATCRASEEHAHSHFGAHHSKDGSCRGRMGHGSCYYEVPVALFISVQFLKSGFLYYISYLPVFFFAFLAGALQWLGTALRYCNGLAHVSCQISPGPVKVALVAEGSRVLLTGSFIYFSRLFFLPAMIDPHHYSDYTRLYLPISI